MQEEGGDKTVRLSEREVPFCPTTLPCSCRASKWSLTWQGGMSVGKGAGAWGRGHQASTQPLSRIRNLSEELLVPRNLRVEVHIALLATKTIDFHGWLMFLRCLAQGYP